MAASTGEERTDAVLPLGVIRDGRIVRASPRLADYLGWGVEDIVGTPFLEHVAPRDQSRVKERHERRLRGEAVPDAYELELRRRDGTSRHAEVYVRFGAPGEVMFELADRTHLANRRAHLRELAGLGAAVQRERSEERIFAVLGAGLVALGVSWARVRADDDGLEVLDVGTPSGPAERLEREAGIRIRGVRGPWGEPTLRAWREGTAYLDDLPLTADAFFGPDGGGPMARTAAREAALGRGICLRVDVDQKPWQLLFVMADWLLAEDVASFGLLRIQVSAALDAARVIADLSARNDELTALNSIGAAAGAGSEIDALFHVTAHAMMRLLGTRWLSIYLFEEATADAILAFQIGLPASVITGSRRIAPQGSNLGEVARTGKPVVWRWQDLRPDVQERLSDMRFAVGASVPLVADARVVGAMNTGYETEHEALPSHLRVLEAAGAHFAAAIRAKRLLDDLRRSYADLARAQEQLVRRERLAALGELAAIVAHEIRNPLGAVFNAVGAIRQQAHAAADDRLTTLLAILEEEATRMNDIVGDLLDFARPVSAALRPEQIEPIVTEAVDAAAHEALGPLEVERDIDENLPAVPVDGRLLRQAILNIALNAVQALGTRGGRVTLRLKRDEGAVRIEIADTGPGISGEHQARVFEPFFTTRASGTGLGLTVVKRIVDVHHGEAALRTSPGAGATFVIRLPVA
jgi:PAS domain S-box-containing protein